VNQDRAATLADIRPGDVVTFTGRGVGASRDEVLTAKVEDDGYIRLTFAKFYALGPPTWPAIIHDPKWRTR
jgi:hypothetical protein